jgi:TP901 family phage tail tape measure protein
MAAGGAFRAIAASAGVVITAFGIGAIRSAIRFQEQLATINTIARFTEAQTVKLGRSLRAIAVDRGIRLDDLSTSYYEFLSAGITIGDSFDALKKKLGETAGQERLLSIQNQILKATTDLAIGGLSTQTEATTLMSFALNTFNLNQTTFQKKVADGAGITARTVQGAASQVSNYFAKAVEIGVVKADQIAKTFSTVGLTAKNAGIGIDEIAAAYAFLTQRGFSAARVTVSMNRAILELIKPGKVLQGLMDKTHISFQKIAKEKGLQQALQEMRDQAAKANIPFVDLFKRQEAYRFALALTSDRTDKADIANAKYAETLVKVHKSVTDTIQGVDQYGKKITITGTSAIQAYIRSDTLSRNLIKLQESFRSVGIEIATSFLDPINSAVKQLTYFINRIDRGLQNLSASKRALLDQGLALTGLVGALLAASAGLQGFLIIATRTAPLIGVTGTNLFAVQKVLRTLIFPLALLIGAFGAFDLLVKNNIAGFGQYRHELDTFSQTAAGVVAGVRQIFTSIGQLVGVFQRGGDVGHAAEVQWTRIKAAFANVGPALEHSLAIIGRLLGGFALVLGRALGAAIPAIIGWAQRMAAAILPRLAYLAGLLIGWVRQALPGIVAGLVDIAKSVISFAGELVAQIGSFVPEIVTALTQWVRQVGPTILDGLGTVVSTIVTWFQGVAPVVAAGLAAWAAAMAAWLIQNLPNLVGRAIQTALGAVADFIRGSQIVRVVATIAAKIAASLPLIVAQIAIWAVGAIPQIAAIFAEVIAQAVRGFVDGMSNISPILGVIAGVITATLVPALALLAAAYTIAAIRQGVAFGATVIVGIVSNLRNLAIGLTLVKDAVVAGNIAQLSALPSLLGFGAGAAAAAGGVGVAGAAGAAAAPGIAASGAAATGAAGGFALLGVPLLPLLAIFAALAAVVAAFMTNFFGFGDFVRLIASPLGNLRDLLGGVADAANNLAGGIGDALHNFGGLLGISETVDQMKGRENASIGVGAVESRNRSEHTDVFTTPDDPFADVLANLRKGQADAQNILNGTSLNFDGTFSAAPKSAEDAMTDANKKVIQGYKDLRATIKSENKNVFGLLSDAPGTKGHAFKSDKAQIKDLNKEKKKLEALLSKAEKVHDTASTIDLQDRIKEINDFIALLNKAPKAEKASAHATQQETQKQLDKHAAAVKAKMWNLHRVSVQTADSTAKALPHALSGETEHTHHAATTMTGKVTTAVRHMKDEVTTPAQNTATAVATGIVGMVETVKSTVQTNFIGKIVALFSNIPSLFTAGANLLQTWINGMNSKLPGVEQTAKDAAGHVSDYNRGKSPPPKGPLKDIDKGGARIIQSWLGGMRSQFGAIKSTAALAAGAFSPAPVLAGAAIGGASRHIVPIGGGRGHRGDYDDHSVSMRQTELLADIAANSRLAAAAGAAASARDPRAGGPLAARSTLVALKNMSISRTRGG